MTVEEQRAFRAGSFVLSRVYLLQFKSDCVTKMAFNVRRRRLIMRRQRRAEKVGIISSFNTVCFLSVYTARAQPCPLSVFSVLFFAANSILFITQS